MAVIRARATARVIAPALLVSACVAPGGIRTGAPPASPVLQPSVPPASASVPAGEILLDAAPRQGAVVRGFAPPGTARLLLDGQPLAVAPDGRFVIGLDRDAPPRAVLVAELAGGGQMARTIDVAPFAWRIEHVDTPRRPAVPDAEFARLRAPELARIAAARARDTGSQGWRQGFFWPAPGRLSGLFGAQRFYRGGEAGAYHSGLDLAGGAGAPVTAPADGVVVLAAPEPFTLEGRIVILDHGMGLNSAFLHLSAIDVREGDVVRRGQRIGAIGATGRVTGPHLHWAVKWRGARVDPATLIDPAAPPRPGSLSRPASP